MRIAKLRHTMAASDIVRCAAVASWIMVLGSLQAQRPHGRVVTIASSDVSIRIIANEHAPRLVDLAGVAGNSWRNRDEESLPTSVEVEGRAIPVRWELKPNLGTAGAQRAEFVYESTYPHLRLHWKWEARAAFGPLEHRIFIENLSDKDVRLPMVDSLRFSWILSGATPLHNLYVEKGADTPSAQGTHLDAVAPDYHWTGKSSTYAHPIPAEAREIIPVEVIYTDRSNAGWFAGIEFSGRTRITLERTSGSLNTVLGLNPNPEPFRTRVEPGGSFSTPTVFVSAFTDGPDGAGNQLRPWVRAVLGNPRTWNDSHYPLTVNNSWGSGMQADEALALRMIDESRELGLEMFHLDAGWFRGVGDWYPDAKKFPHGLAAIADAAHQHGLRFGLWVDWAQAGVDTAPGALNVQDPKVRDWLVTDLPPGWKPEEFKGQTADVGVPAAHDYFEKEVKRIVESYHLDMLEHDGYVVAQGCIREDHPHAAPVPTSISILHDSGFDFVTAPNSTDVSYHAVNSYYNIYEKIRREHPGLLFEICNDGGRMVDFGAAAHGDYFSITDTYDPLSNRRAFYDTSYALPPAMLESYVEKWPTPRLENFLYMLRSGMMGWVSIMLDTTAWSAQQHAAGRQAIALYKEQIRPLIRDARLYHISPRPDGAHWDGIEYWDPSRGKGVIFVFHGSDPAEQEHRFVLEGLNPSAQYRLHFEDSTAPDRTATGAELLGTGLNVHLAVPLSSELVFFQSAGQKIE